MYNLLLRVKVYETSKNLLISGNRFFLCGCNETSADSNSSNTNSGSSISIVNGDSSSSTDKDSGSDDSDKDGSDKDDNNPPEPVESKITNVTISNNIDKFYVGETTYELTASVEGTGDFNKYVTFEEYHSTIINVETNNNHPYIKALKAGTTQLVAVANGDKSKKASTSITVLDPIVESISLSLTSPITLEKNDSVSLRATVSGRGNYQKRCFLVSK